eukprot:4714538-Pyramimonas_sp.AAC.2
MVPDKGQPWATPEETIKSTILAAPHRAWARAPEYKAEITFRNPVGMRCRSSTRRRNVWDREGKAAR